MTREEAEKEWRYRYHERLGTICDKRSLPSGQRPATDQDKALARAEADEALRNLKEVA